MLIINSTTGFDGSSDAGFRAGGLAFMNAFITAGWVRQNDTGIINWATVTRPGSSATPAGWDLIKMNDSLSGSYPCYAKFEFGSGSNTSGMGMWITVGTGTDGAGNLTGQVGTRVNVWNSNYLFGQTPPTNPTRISADTNRLGYSFFNSNGPIYLYFFIERSHNATGIDTTDGIITLFSSSNGTNQIQYIPYTGTVPSGRTYTAAVTPATGTGAFGTNVQLYPIRIWNIGESSPMLGCFLYFNADLTAGNAITATTWDGNSHSIWPFGYSTGFPTTYGGTTVVAMRND